MPRHRISQGCFCIIFFFFPPFPSFEKQAASGTQANWDTGKILSILSIMHGKYPSGCGTHQQCQSFQQLLLWSHSCPSITQAAKVAPSLFHLIWAENDRQESEGERSRGRAAGGRAGLCVQLPKAVSILPGHPLNEDLPSWSVFMAGDFSKSTTCFSRSPEQKSLFTGMKSMVEIFPPVPSAFKGISVLSPRAVLLFKAFVLCRLTLCSQILLFSLFIASHPLCPGKFPQPYWTATLPVFVPISPQSP